MSKKYLDSKGLSHFLEKLKSERPIIELTSAEYKELELAGEIDMKAFYFITDSDVDGRNPDTSMSSTSTNTVQNKVIKEYIDSKTYTLDEEISSTSTNGVQNKVIKEYVDEQVEALRPDTSMSSTSTNAVQNKVIKEYIDSEIAALEPDALISSTSTNAVQNKVIKGYMDGQVSAILLYVDNKINSLRSELISAINNASSVVVSDTEPTDTRKIWIDTGAD